MIWNLDDMLRGAASSRRSFLRRSGAAAVAVGGASALLTRDASAAAKAFTPAKSAILKVYFDQIQNHEGAHVTFLVNALGTDARPEPTFQGLEQSTYAKFITTAQALENTGVGAYLGAAPVIDSSEYLAAAGSILTVEARHSGFLNSLVHDPITGQATDLTTDVNFDTPLTPAEVDAAAGPFIASLNGGPAVTYDDATSSPENDIAILNFALALEYLERDFYNINVPKYFKTGKK